MCLPPLWGALTVGGSRLAGGSMAGVTDEGETAVTEEQVQQLQYFWLERGDLTRWIGFQAALADLAREHPEVLKAWQDYLTARMILDAVIKQL